MEINSLRLRQLIEKFKNDQIAELSASGYEAMPSDIDVSQIISTADANSDNVISEDEYAVIMQELSSAYGVDSSALGTYIEEEQEIEAELARPLASTDEVERNEASQKSSIEDYDKQVNAFGEVLTKKLPQDEDLKTTLGIYSDLTKNLEEIKELQSKGNLSKADKAKLLKLLNERQEYLTLRDEFESGLLLSATGEIKDSLTQMQEIRSNLNASDLQNSDDVQALIDSLTPEEQQAQQAKSGGGASGASGAGGGSYAPTTSTDSTGAQDSTTPTEYGNIDANMSLEDLISARDTIKGEITTFQTAFDTAQTELENAKTLETDALNKVSELEADKATAQQEIDDANNAMMELVENLDTENAKALKEKEAEIVANDELLTQCETDIETARVGIATKEGEITQKETEISTSETTISGYRETISSLKSQLASVSNGETEAEKNAAIKKRQDLKAEIAAQDKLLQDEIAKKQKLEQDKQTLIDEKAAFEATMEEQIGLRDGYLETKTTLEADKNEILEKMLADEESSPELKAAIEAYNTAKTKNEEIIKQYDEAKNASIEASKAVLEAQKTVDTKRQELDTKKAELQEAENLITQKEVEEAQNTSDEGSDINFGEFGFAFEPGEIDTARLQEFQQIYEKNKGKYEEVARKVEEKTGRKIAPQLIAAIHEMESSCNFETYLHNGQKLGQTTTIVPKGKYFTDWTEAAVDAIVGEMDSAWTSNASKYGYGLDIGNNYRDMLLFAERYNGFGTRMYHNRMTSYVYAGTSEYSGGMYVADGKYDASKNSKRAGVALLIAKLCGKV